MMPHQLDPAGKQLGRTGPFGLCIAADAATVLVVVLVFCIQMLFYLSRASVAWGVAVIIVGRWAHLAEHNQAHILVFGSAKANLVFESILVLTTAVPLELYRVHHVETHHQYDNGPNDWTSPFAYRGASFPDRPVHMLKYVLTFAPRAWLKGTPIVLRSGRSRVVHFIASGCVLGSASLLLVLHHPMGFVAFFAVPWFILWLGLAFANWSHHRGCDYALPQTSANINLGFWSKRIGFNIGYHSTHHSQPDLHWSSLPCAHDQMRRRADRGRQPVPTHSTR
jgi:beta-carotene hydroxylase